MVPFFEKPKSRNVRSYAVGVECKKTREGHDLLEGFCVTLQPGKTIGIKNE